MVERPLFSSRQACAFCHEKVLAATVRLCNECGRAACPKCQWTCQLCGDGKKYCQDHIHICSECGAEVCGQHSRTCPDCQRPFCSQHLYACAICGTSVCRQCLRQCPLCGQTVCGQDLVMCGTCQTSGTYQPMMCRGCADVCDQCHSPQHMQHLELCELSGVAVCPGCRVACTDCRRLIAGQSAYAHGKKMLCVRCHNETARKRHWTVAVAAGVVFLLVLGGYLGFA